MSILDSVTPDAWAREWEGDDSDLGQYCVVFHEDEKDNSPGWFTLHSRESVESIIEAVKAETRKEVLLEAIQEISTPMTGDEPAGFAWTRRHFIAVLRRMAESDKGGDDGT